jgi:hypothetical protein
VDDVSLTEATSMLRHSLRRNREILLASAVRHHRSSEFVSMLSLQDAALARVTTDPGLPSREAAAEHDRLVRWFEAYDITGGWDLAPSFVRAGLGVEFLDQVLRRVGDELIDDAVHWLSHAVEAELLLQLMESGTLG